MKNVALHNGATFFVAGTNAFSTIIEIGLRFRCKLSTTMRNTGADTKRGCF